VIVSLLLLAGAGALAAKQVKADAKSKRDCARYQSTIDRATELIGDGGPPTKRRR
jgi:hypothetical protein